MNSYRYIHQNRMENIIAKAIGRQQFFFFEIGSYFSKSKFRRCSFLQKKNNKTVRILTVFENLNIFQVVLNF